MLELNIYPKDKEILCRKTINIDMSLVSEFSAFVEDMKLLVAETDNAVGLSANQVWKSDKHACPRIFVMATTDGRGVQEYINPTVYFSGPSIKHVEGCLSRPGKLYRSKRSKNCTIHYFDINGNEHTEKYGGAYAQIIGHEMDHLNGKILKKEFKR